MANFTPLTGAPGKMFECQPDDVEPLVSAALDNPENWTEEQARAIADDFATELKAPSLREVRFTRGEPAHVFLDRLAEACVAVGFNAYSFSEEVMVDIYDPSVPEPV